MTYEEVLKYAGNRPGGSLVGVGMAWLSFVIPGSVLALMALAVFELAPRRRRKRSGAPLSATYVNEVTAMFYGTKRIELDHRDSQSLMREDDAEAAPPRMGVDLTSGIVTVRPEDEPNPQ